MATEQKKDAKNKLESFKQTLHKFLHEENAFTYLFALAEKYTKLKREYIFVGAYQPGASPALQYTIYMNPTTRLGWGKGGYGRLYWMHETCCMREANYEHNSMQLPSMILKTKCLNRSTFI